MIALILSPGRQWRQPFVQNARDCLSSTKRRGTTAKAGRQQGAHRTDRREERKMRVTQSCTEEDKKMRRKTPFATGRGPFYEDSTHVPSPFERLPYSTTLAPAAARVAKIGHGPPNFSAKPDATVWLISSALPASARMMAQPPNPPPLIRAP